ncbi:Altered inheritance of mitochondria protein 6 [Lithohypha guttulata]|nr:Altered inheritance of mitochondria protein 6 [Lithohypha guttulata]
MLLGLVEFVLLIIGLIESSFPSELEAYSAWQSPRPSDPTSHWPTDYTADVQPVQCHSHNDYWRPIPLRNAVEAGCTGVEADVWLLPDRATDDLLVGHSRASLIQQRTFRSLYIEPLVEILDKQNPNTTYHSTLDLPRNGVFDTNPEQDLVLLVDFKTDGNMLWPMVREQLEPLRRRQYLTHFNGTDLVSGPITVVVTGNAPFDEVVKNSHYRDMFFDAPLDLLASLAPNSDDINRDSGTALPSWTHFDDAEERNYLASLPTEHVSSKKPSNQGQGRSGATPKNPAIYTPANSYYASVAFTKAVGFPHPFLSWKQKQKIRQQIQGAHKQGLKVRYWDTPSWPRGLKEYVWTVLVEEGVDYLNVDDLQEATRGDWGRPRHRKWGLLDWGTWSR